MRSGAGFLIFPAAISGADFLVSMFPVIVFHLQTNSDKLLKAHRAMWRSLRCGCLPLGSFWDLWVIVGLLGHPEIGTAITKCFEHLDDDKYILDPGQLFP